MTSRQFIEHTRRYARAEVERAEAIVLAGGQRPVADGELGRFRLLVWLELQGKLLRDTASSVRAS